MCEITTGVAAVLTPPDPVSQIGLAVPTILLYEISIWTARIVERQREERRLAREKAEANESAPKDNEASAAAETETCRLLTALAERLTAGADYYCGEALTALDIYSAAFMALFAPLPQAQCAMHPGTRAVFETLSPAVQAALTPELLAHRDRIYERHLELPLQL